MTPKASISACRKRFSCSKTSSRRLAERGVSSFYFSYLLSLPSFITSLLKRHCNMLCPHFECCICCHSLIFPYTYLHPVSSKCIDLISMCYTFRITESSLHSISFVHGVHHINNRVAHMQARESEIWEEIDLKCPAITSCLL